MAGGSEMNLFTFALRNIARGRARVWVTVASMAFAGAIMIYYAALMEGFMRATQRNAVAMELGHLQMHLPGYRDDPDLYARIADPGRIVATLEGQGLAAAPRLFAFGLAAAGTSSAGIGMRGVDLAREPRVTELDRHLLKGTWLREESPAAVVVGRKLARSLGVEVGDEIVVVGQATDGSMANDLFRVGGILKSVGEGLDRNGFLMTESAFRRFMIMESGAHEIAIRLPEGGMELTAATGYLETLFPELEVKNWRQLQPVVARIVDLSRSSLIIMLVITYAAVGILALNAMLMSVFERIPEFGVMKALGTSPLSVFGLIACEALIQVSCGALLALAAGVPLALYNQSHPLDLSFLASTSSTIAGIAVDPVWYASLTVETVVLPVLFLYIISMAAVLYPAAKAALIRPLAAIYHR